MLEYNDDERDLFWNIYRRGEVRACVDRRGQRCSVVTHTLAEQAQMCACRRVTDSVREWARACVGRTACDLRLL